MPTGRHRRALLIALAAIVAAGVVLRLLASLSDFWLDEIWSLRFAKGHSPWAVLADLHHDNNHLLNTLWLQLMGDPDHWLPYRLLALVTGSIALPLMICLAWSRGSAAVVFTALLGAASFLLIHYASEARGYGPAVCFSLAAMLILRSHLRSPRWPTAIAFWITSALAVLAHYTFLFPYAALGLWSVLILWKKGGDSDGRPRSILFELLRIHAIPALLLIALYFLQIRHLSIGGGPQFSPGDVMLQALATCVGHQTMGNRTLLWILAMAVLAMSLSECVCLARERRSVWWFYVLLLAVTPILTLIIRPQQLYIRYFIVCIPFLIVLIGQQMSRWWRWHLVGKVACVILLGYAAFENTQRLRGILGAGRGQYFAAVKHMAENSPNGLVRVSSDMDFRNGTVLDYYRKFVPGGLEYHSLHRWPTPSPQWFLEHSFDGNRVPHPTIPMDTTGDVYEFVRAYEFGSMSGWRWFLYRRRD